MVMADMVAAVLMFLLVTGFRHIRQSVVDARSDKQLHQFLAVQEVSRGLPMHIFRHFGRFEFRSMAHSNCCGTVRVSAGRDGLGRLFLSNVFRIHDLRRCSVTNSVHSVLREIRVCFSESRFRDFNDPFAVAPVDTQIIGFNHWNRIHALRTLCARRVFVFHSDQPGG